MVSTYHNNIILFTIGAFVYYPSPAKRTYPLLSLVYALFVLLNGKCFAKPFAK
jgi:hypothetical protein